MTHPTVPDADGKPALPQWRAFLELGFRPLYLAGCFWAAAAIAIWICAPGLAAGMFSGVAWHAHEMLWGFVATIAVGFLFTAASNWTGINPLQGRALFALCALWALARIGYLLPGKAAFVIAAGCELAFFAWAAASLSLAICRARSMRNYGVPFLVLGLGIADALYLVAAAGGDHASLMRRFDAGLLCMALITLLIARRVIPFFAMRAVPGLTIPMHTRTGHVQLAASALALVFGLMQIPAGEAVALAVAGIIALVQLASWKPWHMRRQPLLWILYAGYAGIGIGLLVAAAHALDWVPRRAWSVHVIGMAGFSVLIIGMVTRTALGHLGRPLRPDASMVAAYVLVIAAALLRLAAMLPTGFAVAALHLSATAWVAAFALYLWRFFPMLIRPRRDSPPMRAILQPASKPAASR